VKNYTPTIGLEVHAELKTRTKMFCDSANDPDEARPNVNVCPVCMGFPGTLPVVNREAIRHVLKVGTAVDGELADYTEFDRKNYFYPDLPKGYQISQYEFPLISGGELAGVKLTRIHLEEDAARSQHDGDGQYSLVDFNRAGLPLMELVTEPVIHDAKTASFFAEELQRLLRALGAGEANMEKGQMRVEANISISDSGTLGTKVEVKNINSFRAVEKAIAYEIERQTKLLEAGEKVIQETRGWDENKEVTFSQRLKEGSQDYRYFPDPDIPKFRLSRITEFKRESIRASLPELPWERRARHLAQGLRKEDAEVFVMDKVFGDFFDNEVAAYLTGSEDLQTGANYLLTDIRGKNPTHEELERLARGVFASLLKLVKAGDLSSRGAKDLIAILLKEGGEPQTVAKERGLLQMKDSGLLDKLAEEVIAENPGVTTQVKEGKMEGMKFLIGQGMKKSKGSANPSELERLFKEKLSS
jgi:aspartyl-tRNA(Asn)/glutamyl-tRNA(Gln) amidotransferase subunit B